MRITIVVLSSLLLISIGKKEKIQEINTRIPSQPVNDTIKVTNKTGQTVELYNSADMIFSDVFATVWAGGSSGTTIKISNTYPVFLFAAEGATLIPFPLEDGEHLSIVLNPHNKPTVVNEHDTIRTRELSFFQQLYGKHPFPQITSAKITSLQSYSNTEQSYKIWYKQAISYLNEYAQLYPVRHSFITTARNYLYYEYLRILWNQTENHQNVLSIKFPECDSCSHLLSYRFALYNYVRSLVKQTNGIQDFASMYDCASQAFLNNSSKQYILYHILEVNMDEHLSHSDYKGRISSYLETYKNDYFGKILQRSYSDKSTVVSGQATTSMNEEKLQNVDGQFISFKAIINKHKGKVIYLDFWARWCAPCIEEIPFTQKLENKFKNKDVVFIYVSIDKRRDIWLKGCIQLNFTSESNSYLIGDFKSSAIAKHYAIKNIPRYILIGKKGQLINRDAPRPSDPETEKLLNSLSSAN